MLAMSTVLRREEPFKTIFGYALVFGEDGRPMHKSWGNAIEFDEAAERMGVDVMRWMFAKARPEENILFGWHAADEARRELLILWNVYAFFVTYARLAGWTPAHRARPPVAERPRPRPLDPVARRGHGGARSRSACATSTPSGRPARCRAFIDDLSTWYLRLSRERMLAQPTTRPTSDAAFATLHEALVATSRMLAPILPFLADSMYDNLVAAVDAEAPDSVHLTRWPTADLAAHRDPSARGGRWRLAQRAVDLARTLRGANGLRTRQPLARAWLARPGSRHCALDAGAARPRSPPRSTSRSSS